MPRKRTPNARKGPLTKGERALVEAVSQGIDSKADIDQAVKTLANELAPVMKRNPEALRSAIRDARERLHERAISYVDAHHQATQQALAAGENDVAGKLAWQAIERLAHDGERVIEPAKAPEAGDGRVAVQIIIPTALGGVKPNGIKALPGIEVVDALPPDDGSASQNG